MKKVAVVLAVTFLVSFATIVTILAQPITNLVGHFAFWEIGIPSFLGTAMIVLIVAAIHPRLVRRQQRHLADIEGKLSDYSVTLVWSSYHGNTCHILGRRSNEELTLSLPICNHTILDPQVGDIAQARALEKSRLCPDCARSFAACPKAFCFHLPARPS